MVFVEKRELIVQKEIECAVLQYYSDNVYELHMRNVLVSIEDAHKMVRMQGELTGWKRTLVLVVADEYTDIETEARHYMSTKEALQYSLAEAYVLKSLSQRLLGNFYLKFQRPSVPTRMFGEIDDARKWLHSRKF